MFRTEEIQNLRDKFVDNHQRLNSKKNQNYKQILLKQRIKKLNITFTPIQYKKISPLQQDLDSIYPRKYLKTQFLKKKKKKSLKKNRKLKIIFSQLLRFFRNIGRRCKLQIYQLCHTLKEQLSHVISQKNTFFIIYFLKRICLKNQIGMSMEQQYMCFLFQGYGVNQHLVPTFLNVEFCHQTPFYGTFQSLCNLPEQQSQNALHFNQENQQVRTKDRISKPVKLFRKRHYSKTKVHKNDDNSEKEIKKIRVYEKDKDRNVLPNALSKIFFFMRSLPKSKDLIQKILINNPHLSRYATISKYYTYQNIIRATEKRFKTFQNLKKLFNLIDQQYEIFSMEEQLCFIKINSILLRYYLKNNLYLFTLFSSPRSPRDKIKVYFEKYRVIQQNIQQCINQAQNSLDFSLIEDQL